MTSNETDGTIGYAAAVEELEEILRELDDDALDIDVLGDRVRRAAELISVCRGRIQAAEIEVQKVVAELAPGESEEHPLF